jgi:hypothetical protein
MNRLPEAHLSADDLDALLARTAPERVQAHLDVCAGCRAQAEADARVVRALEALPQYTPSAEFEHRVMARVTIRRTSPVRSILGLPVRWLGHSPARALAATVTLVVAMSASAVWSFANRDLLAFWGSQALAILDGWLWLGLRTMAANVTAQPWYGVVREWVGTPGRLVLTVALFTVAYAAGLLALRRLVALPSRPVPHANW